MRIVILYVHAIDEFPQNVHMSDIQKALNRNQSETIGLAGIFEVAKIKFQSDGTTKIDIDDRLINGQIGTVCKIATDSMEKAGLNLINSDDAIAKRNKFVPIERVETSIKLKVNKDSSPTIKRTQFPLRHFARKSRGAVISDYIGQKQRIALQCVKNNLKN